MLPQRLNAPLGQREGPPRLLCLGIPALADRPPDLDVRRHVADPLQMDVLPLQCPELLRTRSSRERQDDVGVQPVGNREMSPPSTCSGVSDFDFRPARPAGTSASSTTFRFTRSRAIARRTDRLRHPCTRCKVAVLNDFDSSTSQASTSRVVRSRNLRAPTSGITCLPQNIRYFFTVDVPWRPSP
jgi:hypothetical protein